MMVERYPHLKEDIGGSNFGCEVSSLPDGRLARWSTASCALAITCQPFVSENKNYESHFPLQTKVNLVVVTLHIHLVKVYNTDEDVIAMHNSEEQVTAQG
jgi:hypothetical protein